MFCDATSIFSASTIVDDDVDKRNKPRAAIMQALVLPPRCKNETKTDAMEGFFLSIDARASLRALSFSSIAVGDGGSDTVVDLRIVLLAVGSDDDDESSSSNGEQLKGRSEILFIFAILVVVWLIDSSSSLSSSSSSSSSLSLSSSLLLPGLIVRRHILLPSIDISDEDCSLRKVRRFFWSSSVEGTVVMFPLQGGVM